MIPDNYFTNDDDPREEMLRAFIRAIGMIFAFVLILFFITLLTGCKTRTVVVETVRTDTTYITKRDSIYIKDSTHVSEQQHGDTILMKITEWHTKYIDRAVHDTTYIAKTDSVPVPYPVEVKVPRELSWWQKALQRTGGIALILLLVWIGRQAWKIYTKRFY